MRRIDYWKRKAEIAKDDFDRVFYEIIKEELKALHRAGMRMGDSGYLNRMMFDTSALIEASSRRYDFHIFSPEILNPSAVTVYCTEGVREELLRHKTEVNPQILRYMGISDKGYAFLIPKGSTEEFYKLYEEAIERAIEDCRRKGLIKGDVGACDKEVIAAALGSERPIAVVAEDRDILEPLKEISRNRRQYQYRKCCSGKLVLPIEYKKIYSRLYSEQPRN